jgi:hypothetical protein
MGSFPMNLTGCSNERLEAEQKMGVNLPRRIGQRGRTTTSAEKT